MAKTKFLSPNIPGLLGVTPISLVSDEEIWTELITPQVRALLGDVQESRLSVREAVEGDFVGDEVTNYNDHRLYGGQTGFIRFPYVNSFYKTAYGALVIKRDGLKFKVLAWHGKLGKEADLIFKVALRDRRYDGTSRAHDTSLVDFPIYNDAVNNAPLQLEGMPVDSACVELSVYGFMPGSRIVDATGDPDYDRFVASPFEFVDKPEVFLAHFNRAWASKRAPGQNGNPVPDVSRYVGKAIELIAERAGYDYIENASSHFHVAKWAESLGYRYTNPKQAATLAAFTEGIKGLLESGVKLTRPQQSWVCVAQSLPKEHIPAGLDLGGPIWPQDNVGPENLWMYKPLSERAKQAADGKGAKSSEGDSAEGK